MQRPKEDTAPWYDSQEELTGWVIEGDEAPAERAEGAPTGEGAANDAGAWSVTRPPENTGEETLLSLSHLVHPQVLLTGTDTLDLGLYVEFPESYPRLVRLLARWKRAAKGTKGLVVGGGRCLVSPGGKPNYPFLLQYPQFVLYLSRHARPVGDTPNVYVSLGARLLWECGEPAALHHAVEELRALSDGLVREVRVSRADITADLLVPGGIPDTLLRTHAVKRSRETSWRCKDDRLQTFYVGSGQSEILLRIYDKSAEIVHSEKFWFLDLWGLILNADVWRFEFQLRRPVLKSMGLNNLDDWMNHRGTVWRYLTEDWFSLRLPDNENASRRIVHPLWQTVQAAAPRFDAGKGTIHRQRSQPSLDTAHLVKQLAGGLVGLCTRLGVINFAEAKQLLNTEFDREFRERDFETACQKKAIELGLEGRREVA